jgi:hypothetical protein
MGPRRNKRMKSRIVLTPSGHFGIKNEHIMGLEVQKKMNVSVKKYRLKEI